MMISSSTRGTISIAAEWIRTGASAPFVSRATSRTPDEDGPTTARVTASGRRGSRAEPAPSSRYVATDVFPLSSASETRNAAAQGFQYDWLATTLARPGDSQRRTFLRVRRFGHE